MSEFKKNPSDSQTNVSNELYFATGIKSNWSKPVITSIKIEDLTEGFGPSFRDLRLPLFAAS